MSVVNMITAIYRWLRPPDVVSGTTTANWNSGVATSGLAGADLVTIGQANQWWMLSEIYMRLASFNAAATVTVRAYEVIMGAEQLVMDEDYVVAAEPDIIFIFWFWNLYIYDQVRIEVYSDQAADDGLAAPYEHRSKSL